jgi:hypothetical protein
LVDTFHFFIAARTHKYGRQKPSGDYGDDDEEADDYGDAGIHTFEIKIV